MRFIALVLGIAVISAIVYFSILFWGLGRSLPHFENPFSTMPQPMVLMPWDSKLVEIQTPGLLERRVLWFHVYRDADGSLKALASNQAPSAQEEVPINTSTEGPRLRDAVARWVNLNPQPGFVFQIHSNVDGIQNQFVDELKGLDLKRVLVQSEFDNVMQTIKVFQPMWAYGTSASDRVRWMNFAALGLAPAVTSRNDIYVTPLKIRNIPALSRGIVDELRRREDLLWIGPLMTHAEVEQARQDQANGYFVTTPEAFEALPEF